MKHQLGASESRYRLLILIALFVFFIELFIGMFYLFPPIYDDISALSRLYLIVRIPLLVLAGLTFFIYQMVSRLRFEREWQELEKQQTQLQLEQSLELISSLQSQRREFRNQLQVIQTTIALGKYQELTHYIEACRQTLDEVASLNRIENPVLQALFLTTQGKARELDIQFSVDCRADLKALAQSPVKVFRIFSNLLQNALEAAMLDRSHPSVVTTIRQDRPGYHFSIWNSGPPIPPEHLDRLFEGGFSTKGGLEHQGYGLYIAKTLCEEMGGLIEVNNKDGGVEYLVRLPSARNLDMISSDRLA